MPQTLKPVVAAAAVLFYLIVRIFFVERLDEISPYGSYIFEALFVAAVLACYRGGKLPWFKEPRRKDGLEGVAAFMLGVLIFVGATVSGLPIPFDLTSAETILFLLVIGPILEELIFRRAIWLCLNTLWPRREFVIAGTALLFAMGHLQAWFIVTDEVRPFVVYQGVYTLALGVWWGWRVAQGRAFATVTAFHILFNLGFFVAYLCGRG